jgi:hypothetical protein
MCNGQKSHGGERSLAAPASLKSEISNFKSPLSCPRTVQIFPAHCRLFTPIYSYSSLFDSPGGIYVCRNAVIRPRVVAIRKDPLPAIAGYCQPLPAYPPTPIFFHGGCHLQRRYFVRWLGVFAPLREVNQARNQGIKPKSNRHKPKNLFRLPVDSG